MKRLSLLAFAPAAAAVVIAGCGGGGGGGGGNTQQSKGQTVYGGAPAAGSKTTANAGAGPGSGATVALRKLKVGTALVDAQGRTLYLFEADKTTTSTCK